MASTPPGASAALTHPSGSRVYLVGVAHVSAKGQTASKRPELSEQRCA
jgi:hypothetical protein